MFINQIKIDLIMWSSGATVAHQSPKLRVVGSNPACFNFLYLFYNMKKNNYNRIPGFLRKLYDII
jgi:hypothetical protein